jgi:hypothetical protein
MTVIIIGGLITWLVTKIVVESRLFEPIRDWVFQRSGVAVFERWFKQAILRAIHPANYGADTSFSVVGALPAIRWHHRLFNHLHYLLTCDLCTGVWVGWIIAALFAPTFGLGVFLGGLRTRPSDI